MNTHLPLLESRRRLRFRLPSRSICQTPTPYYAVADGPSDTPRVTGEIAHRVNYDASACCDGKSCGYLEAADVSLSLQINGNTHRSVDLGQDADRRLEDLGRQQDQAHSRRGGVTHVRPGHHHSRRQIPGPGSPGPVLPGGRWTLGSLKRDIFLASFPPHSTAEAAMMSTDSPALRHPEDRIEDEHLDDATGLLHSCRGASRAVYISPRSFRLAHSPPRVRITWSMTSMPTSSPACTRRRVRLTSSFEGVGSPEGWL